MVTDNFIKSFNIFKFKEFIEILKVVNCETNTRLNKSIANRF